MPVGSQRRPGGPRRCAQEATKCSWNNWKVWENYSAVAIDVAEYAEAARAIMRLIEIRKSFNDWRVLGALVKAAVREDAAESLRSRVEHVLDALKGATVSEPRVWSVAAHYCQSTGKVDAAHDYRRSAYAMAKTKRNWEKEDDNLAGVVECIADICDGERVWRADDALVGARGMFRGKGRRAAAWASLQGVCGASMRVYFVQNHRRPLLAV